MRRIAHEIGTAGATVADLSEPGWVATDEKISAAATKIRNLDPTDSDVVFLDVWSNSTYLGSDKDGFPVKPVRGPDGRYHIVGSLQVAHRGVFQRILQDCTPLMDAAEPASVVLVVPFPRYMIAKCCNDDGHISNFGDADYLEEISKPADVIPGAVAGIMSLRKCKIISLPDMASHADPPHPPMSLLDELNWADPVHLSRDIYAKVGAALLSTGEGLRGAGPAPKRTRLDSIAPTSQSARGGRAVPLPGWVLGRGPLPPPRGRGRGGNYSRFVRGGPTVYGRYSRQRAGGAGRWRSGSSYVRRGSGRGSF